MWKNKSCHVVNARIDKFAIHQGSFHTLKGHGLLNYFFFKFSACANCDYIYDQVVNGYLTIQLANTRKLPYEINTLKSATKAP